MPSLFAQALQRGEAIAVNMNRVEFASFTSSHRSIGTADLNSCTAVMIVSAYGAILAHIAPRPDDEDPNDLNAGDRHVAEKMDEMGTLYRQVQKFFPKEKPSWIVSAVYRGEVALPDQQAIIETKLQQWGLEPSIENYDVVEPPLPENGKGTIFIDARNGGFPIVYVEDKAMSGGPTLAPQASSSAHQSNAQSSSSGSLALADFEAVAMKRGDHNGISGIFYQSSGQTFFAKDESWERAWVGGGNALLLRAKKIIAYPS